jgi:flagellar basal body rod protein FlgB
MSMIESSLAQRLARFLDVNVYRHALITSNLANIDTPGYPEIKTVFSSGFC